ncbi:MAG: 2-oxoacid:ferredoxin oxidoreductase subunit beta [Chloroflexi bacterium]|nr:2-oxoacid:ferredoxin oxidoreductase subunit beta [Chloroflexota bacterium]
MAKTNAIGLTKADYKGAPSTLCQGCGHNSILSQIISALFEMNVVPEDVAKFSGIGCSSKAPTYMLSRSFGFNGLHGRMPPLATGALVADPTIKGIGMSGDGDTASIGMGHFKHIIRRNVPLVYIVANNGVYGLTKGQFSATADKGLRLKRQGENPYMPIDICMEALASNATFVARTFAGDPKQVKTLLKAAYHHKGLAVIDIISPCVTFNNQPESRYSYSWAKDHEAALHQIDFVPPREEIWLDKGMEPGEARTIRLHDGSAIVLKQVAADYDPTDRFGAIKAIEESYAQNVLLTGLLYIDPEAPNLYEILNLPDEPLNRLTPDRLRPTPEQLAEVNASLFGA